MRAIRRFTVRPVLPPELEPLRELALNLRWCWDVPTQRLFAAVDPGLWDEVGHDPVRLLGAVPGPRWAELAADEAFMTRLLARRDDLRAYTEQPRWYQTLGPEAPASVAYFSPEYGITHVLPQYSGGLGILAGDHLKAASDLGVPLVGVGLLYGHGYFVQSLSQEGWQQERYPVLDPASLPLSLLHEADGSPARVRVGLPGGRSLAAAVWVAWVGRVPLLLLDSQVQDNEPAEREVTDRLYGGGTEHRLKQEMLLGIGGVRALRLWSRLTGAPAPEVFHTNEGHAGLLGVERLRELVEAGAEVESALGMVRAGTLFTTHTPVPAGIDRFPLHLVAQYLSGEGLAHDVGLERVLALGAETYPGGDPGVFNMAVMGFRLAQRANGVSRLHGRVSREMFRGLWDQFDADEVPIGSVTNGVHGATWLAPEAGDFVARYGDLVRPQDYAAAVAGVSDDEIWTTKRAMRARLVTDARRRLRRSWEQRGASRAKLGWKCTSSSWTPAKYQGALVGLGLSPGLAGGPSGASQASASRSTAATAASATAASRSRRSGLTGTIAGAASGASTGARGTTSPPALRTRQKWKAISITISTGRTAVCSAKKLRRVSGPSCGPPSASCRSRSPTSGT